MEKTQPRPMTLEEYNKRLSQIQNRYQTKIFELTDEKMYALTMMSEDIMELNRMYIESNKEPHERTE